MKTSELTGAVLDWAVYGGFSNPRLARVTRGRAWAYFYLHR